MTDTNVLPITQTDIDNLNKARELSRTGTLLELYTVFDRLAQTYAPPFTAPNDAVAARLLLATAQQPQSMLEQSPPDFDLYHLGAMNSATGKIFQQEVRHVGNFGSILQAAMSSGAAKA